MEKLQYAALHTLCALITNSRTLSFLINSFQLGKKQDFTQPHGFNVILYWIYTVLDLCLKTSKKYFDTIYNINIGVGQISYIEVLFDR